MDIEANVQPGSQPSQEADAISQPLLRDPSDRPVPALQQRINRTGLVNLAVVLSTVVARVAKPTW